MLANKGKQYALYFPKDAGDGYITLDMSETKSKWELTWLNVKESTWLDRTIEIAGDNKVKLQKPDSGHWAALIEKR